MISSLFFANACLAISSSWINQHFKKDEVLLFPFPSFPPSHLESDFSAEGNSRILRVFIIDAHPYALLRNIL